MAVLLVAGCADLTGIDNPRVEVRTDRASYAFGEEGVLTVPNLHRNDIGVMRTLCGSRIERRVSEEWEHVGLIQSPDDGSGARPIVCPLVMRVVPPGETHSRSFAVDFRFEAGGEYRFEVDFSVLAEQAGPITMQFSNSFIAE